MVTATVFRFERASLFLDHTWRVAGQFQEYPYRLSHLEVVTLDGLPKVLELHVARH